jgi:hypothetical protein
VFGSIRRAILPVLAVGLTFVVAAEAHAYIYVGDANSIARADNDGTDLNKDFIPVDGFACGVAVTGTHIYWADLNSIGRANIDGTGIQQNFVTVPGIPNICGLAADATHLYWADRATAQIGRASLDGTSPDFDFINTGSPACGIAVDADSIYYAFNFSTTSIVETNKSGVPVASNPGVTQPASCAVGVDSNNLYYGDFYAPDPTTDLHRATLSGLAFPSAVPGAKQPCGIVSTGTTLYWTNYEDPAAGITDGTVGRAPTGPDGPTAPPNHQFITGLSEPCGLAVDDLPRPDPEPEPEPDNPTLELGKAKLNKKKGTAKLTVTASDAGMVELSGKKVRPSSATLAAAGSTKLAVKAKGKARKTLKKKGKARVKFTVTYLRFDGESSSQDGAVTLKLKKKGKR